VLKVAVWTDVVAGEVRKVAEGLGVGLRAMGEVTVQVGALDGDLLLEERGEYQAAAPASSIERMLSRLSLSGDAEATSGLASDRPR
jgi:hypothetical protein